MATTSSDTERQQPAPPRASWKRQLWRILRGALLVYAGAALALFMLQTWLIFPGHATQGRRDAVVPPHPDYELLELSTARGERITAVFGRAFDPGGAPVSALESATRPTILFFYGNGMCMADCMGEFRKFRRLGANVMIPDFAGYGMSGGKPSEASFYATADACWAHLMSRSDIDKSRIVASGWSIGAGAAIDLAAREPVAGLAIFSPFTSLPDMARKLLPWLPTSLLLKHRFENERKIATIRVPALIVHGLHDQIIPHGMSDRLAHAAAGKVTRLTVATDHNDLFEGGGDEILPLYARFLTELPPAP